MTIQKAWIDHENDDEAEPFDVDAIEIPDIVNRPHAESEELMRYVSLPPLSFLFAPRSTLPLAHSSSTLRSFQR